MAMVVLGAAAKSTHQPASQAIDSYRPHAPRPSNTDQTPIRTLAPLATETVHSFTIAIRNRSETCGGREPAISASVVR